MNRRELLKGAGVGAAAVVAASVPTALPADAATGPAARSTDRKATLGVPPGVTPIGSAPISGYTYVHRTMWDFSPEHYSSGRAWSPTGGVYVPLGTGDNLWTSVEIPPGALVRDVEWYLSATENVMMMGRVWVAGDAYLSGVVADGSVVASTATCRAARIAVSDTLQGPYPMGTSLVLGIWTPHTGTVSINGVRVGFSQGGGRTGVLPAPIRAYDSRTSGGKLAAGSVRTITLPVSAIAPGASAALVNITALEGAHNGYLKVYPANSGAPAASAVNFASSGAAVANAITVGVSSSRQIKVYASSAVHVIVDVTGSVG